MNQGVLEGYKVVELSTFVAAPACGRILADWGADVIKVESPYRDPMRIMGALVNMPIEDNENVAYDQQNTNKRGLVLDLKSKNGKEALLHLLSDADVFITNTRSQALVKLGIDYESIKVINPKIVYAQVLGFGEFGPDKDKPGFDFTAYFARGGVSGTLYDKEGTPLITVPALGDHQCGLYLSSGVMASLLKASKTGMGDRVTISLMHTAIYGMAHMIVSSQYGKNSYPITRKDNPVPLQVLYKTKDDRLIQLGIAVYDSYYKKFCIAIGHPELIDNEKYNTYENLSKYKTSAEFITLLDKIMLLKTADQWTALFEQHDIPCEKAMLWEEILEDEQAWANDVLRKVDYEDGERILVTAPVKIKSQGIIKFKKGPKFGEHTQEILKEMGYSEEKIEEMYQEKSIK